LLKQSGSGAAAVVFAAAGVSRMAVQVAWRLRLFAGFYCGAAAAFLCVWQLLLVCAYFLYT
jgi:hypothetical protein